MKTLLRYLFESDEFQDLKKHIKNEVDQTDEEHEKLLKKIDKMLSSKGLSRETFSQRLKDIGLDYAEKTLTQKINAYDNLPEFIAMYADIEKLPSVNDLINGNDIYELFDKFGIDKELIEDLGDTELAKSSINKGKYEILTQLFLKDISNNNANYKGKSGDINAGNFALEYKLSGARIIGQGTLNSPELIYQKMTELITNVFNSDNTNDLQKQQSSLLRIYKSDELDKELDNIENNDKKFKEILKHIDKCFQSNKVDNKHSIKNFDTLFNLLINAGLSDDLINTIIAESLLEQIPSRKYKISAEEHKQFIEFVKDKTNAPIHDGKPDYNKMKLIFGAMHMYFYQHIENFDYMLIFKKNKLKGKYVVIKREEYKDFKSIRTAMIDKNINVSSMPSYNTGREYAITITCTK